MFSLVIIMKRREVYMFNLVHPDEHVGHVYIVSRRRRLSRSSRCCCVPPFDERIYNDVRRHRSSKNDPGDALFCVDAYMHVEV